MSEATDELQILVTKEQLRLLEKFAFPGSARVLASAQVSAYGIELSGSWTEFDGLVGWVAGEANHSRRGRAVRRTELLDDIADQLEAVLAGGGVIGD